MMMCKDKISMMREIYIELSGERRGLWVQSVACVMWLSKKMGENRGSDDYLSRPRMCLVHLFL